MSLNFIKNIIIYKRKKKIKKLHDEIIETGFYGINMFQEFEFQQKKIN